MIELTLAGGTTFAINPKTIIAVFEASADSPDYTDILVTAGIRFTVVESYFEVLKLLK